MDINIELVLDWIVVFHLDRSRGKDKGKGRLGIRSARPALLTLFVLIKWNTDLYVLTGSRFQRNYRCF